MNEPTLPLMPVCALSPLADLTETGGQNAQQLVLARVVVLQIRWWVVPPWTV
jgi:hypothetical protein